MKTYTTHSDIEASTLHAGTQTLLVVPCGLPVDLDEDHPGASWELARKPQYAKPNEFAFVDMAHPIESYPYLVDASYAPGEIVAVKEAWWHHKSKYLEQAGFVSGTINRMEDGRPTAFNANPDFDPQKYPIWRKRSSTSMPYWAIRTRLRILSVECRRLRSITPDEIKALGVTLPPTEMFPLVNTEDKLCVKLQRCWDRDHPDHPWNKNEWCWFCRTEKEKAGL